MRKLFLNLAVILGVLASVQVVSANPLENTHPQQAVFHLNKLLVLQAKQFKKTDREYYEYLRTGSMSSGIYVINKGGTDPQQPHTSDEIYYIIGGQAKIRIADTVRSAKAGDLIYVAKNVPHHFFDITKKATVLVIMAPAEQTPQVLLLHDKGLTNQQIKNVLNVKRSTVNSIVKQYTKLGHL